jgi:hypothetical protein
VSEDLERRVDEAEKRVDETREHAEEAAQREEETRTVTEDHGGKAPELDQPEETPPARQ